MLRSRNADVQRTIGMVPLPMEPGNERAGWRFEDIPGLVFAYTLEAPIRGLLWVNGRAFAVGGTKLYELFANGTTKVLTTLGSAVGNVGMSDNTTQLVISDGAQLYVLTLATNVVIAKDFPGKSRIDYINQYIVFVTRDTQQFGWTALGDATSIDPLAFASAEGSPDNLVSLLVDHRDLLLFGTDSTEPWIDSGDVNVFTRNPGQAIEQGIASEFSAVKLDDTVFWLAASARGQGTVLRLAGYVPTPVSTKSIEELLSGKDLSQATAYAYEFEKSKFYCLNVPGLETTLVYDAFTQQWHERAELIGGDRQPHRATHHFFAFGDHYFGAADGKLYRMDPTVSNNDGDPLLRERISPIFATPTRDRQRPERFALDCQRGTGARVQFRMSPDGGNKWGAWRARSTGALGVFNPTVEWKRLNTGRDLVAHVRFTDDAPFNPVQGGVS